MVRTDDVMAGKVTVQLGLCTADAARAALRELDAAPEGAPDLVNRLTARCGLSTQAIETIRHRVALYAHVRLEAIYLRLLEREASIGREAVAELLARLEATAHRRRLGDALVRAGRLQQEADRALLEKAKAAMVSEDARIIARYRDEDWAGVQKPLIKGSRLDPHDFRISTLFRSKETRALVDKVDLEALRREALARSERRPDAAAPPEAAPRAAGAGGHAPLPLPTPVPAPAAADAGPMTMADVKTMRRIGDYDVVEVLGVGGMGAVFLGQKEGVAEYSAIKVMLGSAAGETELGRFKREIELMRRVHHPNVISVLDAGETPGGLIYMVVPALAGKELRNLIDQAGGEGLPPHVVDRVFEQICAGLGAAHDQRIIHRDLKPENAFVLAGAERVVRLMDFGLAKLEDDAPDQEGQGFRTMGGGEVVGSPMYIAPESVSNDPVDRRTDIYSLGVMLFEMLTGKLPLESETTQGFLGQHLICPPATLAEARPERTWPPELEDLLARMLAKTREERPATCAEALAAWKAALPALLAAQGARLATAPPEPPPAAPPAPGPQGGRGLKGLIHKLLGRPG